jgi:hypothetical protein
MKITEDEVDAKFKSKTHLEKVFFIFWTILDTFTFVFNKTAKKRKTKFSSKTSVGCFFYGFMASSCLLHRRREGPRDNKTQYMKRRDWACHSGRNYTVEWEREGGCGWVCEWVKEWQTACELLSEWKSDWRCERPRQWVREQACKWVSEWATGRRWGLFWQLLSGRGAPINALD